jgi:glyoxylase-like metal-dependent hydrolase (beta-lactamase superfamily II)
MVKSEDWYEITKIKDSLYIFQERLDKIEPRFHTVYVNIYLIVGNESALLIDTGCGLFPIKPIINKLIGEKNLIVVNTHSHFDHIGGNSEFEEIYIHENEQKMVSKPFDVSFYFQDAPEDVKIIIENKGFVFQPAPKIKPLKEGDSFDLGELSVKIIHTPGHSIGSITLLTNNGDLFPGDTAHYGTMYLPKRKQFPIILKSISRLLDLFKNGIATQIYPSHEEYPVGKDLLEKLYDGINNIKNIWHTKTKEKFLRAWIIKDENFKYLI